MNTKITLNQIKAEVDKLASQIGASGYILPTYGHSEDGARPHIDVDSRGYHYVVVERGEEFQRITTNDLDTLLYNIFEHVTFDLACKYELERRVVGQDFRRLMFQRQVELLSMLSPRWGETESQEHEKILQQNPYDDNASLRAALTKTLREQGLLSDDAWRRACGQYPLPKT